MRPQNVVGPVQLVLTALAILFLGVSVFAYAWGGQSPWSMHPPGDDDPTRMLHELRREGLDCRPRSGRAEMFDCAYRHPARAGGEPWHGLAGLDPRPVALALR